MIQINAVEGETKILMYFKTGRIGSPSARYLSDMDEKGFSMEGRAQHSGTVYKCV